MSQPIPLQPTHLPTKNPPTHFRATIRDVSLPSSHRLAKDYISKPIVTNSSIGTYAIHKYVSGKYGEMSINLPDSASCQVGREISANSDLDNRYMLL